MTQTAGRRKAAPAPQGSPVTTYYLLAAATTILILIGLAVVLSSSSIASIRSTGGNPWALFLVQFAALVVGLAALILGSRMPIKWWKRMTPLAFYGSLVLLVMVALAGVAVGGNRNWIRIAGFSLQPSELAKLGLALFLGLVLSQMRHQLTSLKAALVPGGIAVAAVLGLVLLGHDMGTAIVIAMIAAGAYWVAGLPARFFGLAGIVGALGAVVLLFQGESRTARINVWLADTCDAQADCMQQTQGLYSLASGGLWGLGPGQSRGKWGYLPASDNDYIFAIVGEEWGLIGTLMILIAFGMILVAVMRLVHRHRDPFVQITSAALGAWIVGQAFINIAVVLGLLPVFGVPLPLVSSGGSSLIASLAALGVLMAFARREPGAQEAFAARPSMIKRSIAVVSRGRRG
ncbi:FtsW/RodA/SpoVE family cell cycle protein [Demequina zhanjiangensis]|uniref:Probable peptidoglycan glycosyltransferase FtsW n=1 Tax=Demequina zhanjiangensis TaxID=3051659 RepID=A0ABT8G3G1_9MICO|nr:putative peptidoglycan glycosyltransferase FtsW [Demequina sp. SYSU T00b26]MDN4473670.1 putative peptidoglycan glycosyltransferase FtsW [Demequina sp. SYSU T00b26]